MQTCRRQSEMTLKFYLKEQDWQFFTSKSNYWLLKIGTKLNFNILLRHIAKDIGQILISPFQAIQTDLQILGSIFSQVEQELFLIIKYNMLKEEGDSQEISGSNSLECNGSINQGHSSQKENESGLICEIKIEEFQTCLERLRRFVTSISDEQIKLLPACVEDYCDKIGQYYVKSRRRVLQMAEWRVKKLLHSHSKLKHNWNREDVTLLVWLVSQTLKINKSQHFSQLSQQDWIFISNMIPGSTWQKCKFKWLSLKKSKLATYKWTNSESEILGAIVAQQKQINWGVVAQKLYEKNLAVDKVFRNAKQCRQHWSCFLNPSIQRGRWTAEEDRKLLEFVLEVQDSKKWSQMAKLMGGRTQNALKNRFNLLVQNQSKISGRLKNQKRLIQICLSRLAPTKQQQLPLSPNIQGSGQVQGQRVESSRRLPEKFEDKSSFQMPSMPSMATMPTIPSPLYHQNQIGFANNYESMVMFNYNFNNMRHGFCPVVPDNNMFFGFVFSNPF